MNLHPHICLISIEKITSESVPKNQENVGYPQPLTTKNKNDSTVDDVLYNHVELYADVVLQIADFPFDCQSETGSTPSSAAYFEGLVGQDTAETKHYVLESVYHVILCYTSAVKLLIKAYKNVSKN